MKNSIKLKHGKELERVMKEPIKLSILVQIAFFLDEDKGLSNVTFPPAWEEEVGTLIFWGLIARDRAGNYRFLNKKVIDLTLKRKPIKHTLQNQPLSGEGVVVPRDLVDYHKITLSFRDLFLDNIKSIGGRVDNIERAKFGDWVTPIRLMIEADKITVNQLREVWGFLREEEFWKDKVQSTSKLRQKFSTLYNQFKANEKRDKIKREQNSKSKGGVSTGYLRGIYEDLQS